MTDTLRSKLKPVFAENNILAVYLFGSQVDGTAQPDSDYDFGILLHRDPELADIGPLTEELSHRISAIIGKKADVVLLNTANIEFRFHVIRTGEVIFSADTDKRTDFEDIVIRDYLDFKPFLDAFHREAREAVKEGGFYGKLSSGC